MHRYSQIFTPYVSYSVKLVKKSRSEHFEKMPFFVSKEEDYKRTLYFQLKETRKVFFELITSFREKNSDVKINTSSFLKLLYSRLDVDSMAEVKYFMSCMINFPVSEAVVET